MTDIVATVPKRLWLDWLDEGNLAGEPWDGELENHFWINPATLPSLQKGDRLYIVAHGRLRGYAPIVRCERVCTLAMDRACLVRRRRDGGGSVNAPAAHNRDPRSSYEALDHLTRSGRRETQKAHILALLVAMPGSTAGELAAIDPRDVVSVRRRLHDLEFEGRARKGEQRRCTVAGNLQLTWEAL